MICAFYERTTEGAALKTLRGSFRLIRHHAPQIDSNFLQLSHSLFEGAHYKNEMLVGRSIRIQLA